MADVQEPTDLAMMGDGGISDTRDHADLSAYGDVAVAIQRSLLVNGAFEDVNRKFIAQARRAVRQGQCESAFASLYMLWKSGYRTKHLYNALVHCLENWMAPVAARDLFALLAARDGTGFARLWNGYFIYRTEGIDAAVAFYAAQDAADLPTTMRNGLRSLRGTAHLDRLSAAVGQAVPPVVHRVGSEAAFRDAPVTFFTATDPRYLTHLGPIYIESLMRFFPAVHVHLLLVNADEECFERLHALTVRHPRLAITYSCETTAAFLASYCINRRYAVIDGLLDAFGRPVVLTDIDFAFGPAFSEIFAGLSGADFGYVSGELRAGYKFLWEMVDGNFTYFAPTLAGKAAAGLLREMVDEHFDPAANQTHYDQSYLFSLAAYLTARRPETRLRLINADNPFLHGVYVQSSGMRPPQEKALLLRKQLKRLSRLVGTEGKAAAAPSRSVDPLASA